MLDVNAIDQVLISNPQRIRQKPVVLCWLDDEASRWTWSPIPVDPLRHEPLVTEALVRNGAALDPGETLGKGDLF